MRSILKTSETICFGNRERLSIEAITAIAKAGVKVRIDDSEDFRRRVAKSVAFLDRLLEEEGVIYGVTTGFGDSCTQPVAKAQILELPLHLTRYHGCGLGRDFDEVSTLAIMAARLVSLSQGYSGVRLELLELLATLINRAVLPRIPEEGSVGASGDLTPLSYLAAAMVGEREVNFRGQLRPSAEVLSELGITPLKLRPKEGLALMNGTAVMTGLACLAFERAEYLTRLCARLTALASLGLQGNANHFDEVLFSVKPHAGQNRVASWLRDDLDYHRHPRRNSPRLQDRYSIRCAPHVIGVLKDALPWLRDSIENELNSANDNPIIDGDAERILHGGHFYGGHIAFAMDAMKTAVANLADLMDRQLALLVDPKFNHGLPANLSGAAPGRGAINHGFKAVQIGTSAWTAEALKLTMPASVFSRSTECHNQDKVSMGTIAARDCLRVLELTEQVAAGHLMAAMQAVRLRVHQGELAEDGLNDGVRAMLEDFRRHFPEVQEDRPLEQELRQLLEHIRARRWSLYETA